MSYADFEGTIPKGEYGGGTVMLWDRGTWEPVEGKSAKDLDKGHLHFTLDGERMKGEWLLIRLKPQAGRKARELAAAQVRRRICRAAATRWSSSELTSVAHRPLDGRDRGGRGRRIPLKRQDGRGIRRADGEGGQGIARQQSAAQAEAGAAAPEISQAAAGDAGRRRADRQWLDARDQVRRLSRAGRGHGRRGVASIPATARTGPTSSARWSRRSPRSICPAA